MPYSDKTIIVADNLRKLRLNAKMSQQSAAFALEISLHCYKEWENAKIDFSLSKLQRISDLFNVEFTSLLLSPPPPQILR
jgi:transcriptional regulator with XRE-family HTH domain